jgi:hypothetical protein
LPQIPDTILKNYPPYIKTCLFPVFEGFSWVYVLKECEDTAVGTHFETSLKPFGKAALETFHHLYRKGNGFPHVL